MLGLALAGTAAAHLHFANVTFDDAFISFRYAENLARGEGLVFNPGERVEGFSNFLWTVLLTVPLLGGSFSEDEVGLLLIAKCFGALLSFATVALLWHMKRSPRTFRPPSGALDVSPLLAPTYFGTLPAVAIWAVSGLETPLVGFLLLLCVHLHLSEEAAFERGQRFVSFSYLALAFAALTRPEPALLLMPLVGLRWTKRWMRRGSRPWVVRELVSLLLFVVPYGLFLVFRYAYYGDLLPNTYYAKLHDDPDAWARGGRYLAAAGRDLGAGSLVLMGIAALGVGRRLPYRVQCLLLLLATWSFAVGREGGDWMPAHRMLVPMLPLVALLVGELAASVVLVEPRHLAMRLPPWLAPPRWAALWSDALAHFGESPSSRRLLHFALGGLLTAVLAVGTVGQYRRLDMQAPSGWVGLHLGEGLHFEAARWIQRELPDPALLALGEAGVVPYLTRFPTLDLFGLTDRHIARQPGPLHRKFDLDYVLGRRPEYVFLLAQRAPDGRWFSNHHHAAVLLEETRFRTDYELLRDFDGAVLFRRTRSSSPAR